jgi:glutathione S-transferase
MLRIWGREDSINVQKVMWLVAELRLKHQRVDIGGQYRGLDTTAYGAKNPNRRVPTIEDDGFTLWESNVIVRYLAAKHSAGRLWPTDLKLRAVADQWMDWQQTTLLTDMRTVFWGLVRTPPEGRDHVAIGAAVESLKLLWARLDGHLEGRRFVAGDDLTVGDIPVGAMCHRYYALPIDRADLANLSSWYNRLKVRPAFQEHVMLPLS